MAKKKMYQRPDGLYETIRIVNGKRVAFRGKTIREVEQKMLEYQADIKNGPLFKAAAEMWWGDFIERAAPNSLKSYRPAMQRAVDRFGGRYATQITAQEIKSWIGSLIRQGYAKKTIKTHLIVLNSIFKLVQEQTNTPCNPAALVRLPQNLPQSARELPSDYDEAQMLANVKSHPFGMFAFLAKFTGCRRGELLGLKFKDFNYDQMTITVERSVYYEGNTPHIKSPKTAAGTRTVPLLDVVAQVMPKGKPEAFIFSDDGGATPLTNSRFEDYWGAYCKDTGITATPHQWRHSYATVLYEAGIDLKDAQKFLGHAQISTTMDIYTHFREQRIAKAAKKLNHFSAAVKLG